MTTTNIRPAMDYAIAELQKAIEAETSEVDTRGATIAAMGIALGALMVAVGHLGTPDGKPSPRLSDTLAETLDWPALADAVRSRRNWLGMSQGEIQKYGGPSEQTMGRIEQNRRVKYTPASLAALEKALRWPPGTINSILTRQITDRKSIITVTE